MPYRRLPNTDKARIRALENAIGQMRNSERYVPVLPPDVMVRAERILHDFRAANEQYVSNLQRQLDFSRSDAYQTRLQTARMYVTHFLLVFNMCIKRKEFKASDRTFYSIPEDMTELPDLSGDAAVLKWCSNVISGERNRMARGGIPVYNPSVAKLAVHYDLFNDLYQKHTLLRKQTDDSLNKVAGMRAETDAMILDIWNRIEHYFSDMSGEERLDACRQYGVVYYYRKCEKAD